MFRIEEKVFLPHSNQRYSVDCEGVVRDGNSELTPYIRDGVWYVDLSWCDGDRAYRYDAILVVCYFKVKIPVVNYDRIQLLYDDENNQNTRIDNLAYRFDGGPVESDVFPGYFYVPYYTDYLIDRSGDVISLKNYRRRGVIEHKKWSVSKPVLEKNITGGYYCGRGKRDHDEVDGVSRHRLLALTFIPYQSDPLKLVVNHKDGVPGNDSLINLEWVTYSENTKHAYRNNLHSNKTVKIIHRNDLTNIEKRYSTIAECLHETGFSDGFIRARIAKPHVKYTDGLRFKLDDGSDWSEQTSERSPSVTKDIVARNVFTGDLTIFSTRELASIYSGVNEATISYHCQHGLKIPINGYNFQYLEIDNHWPEHSAYHLRMYRRFPSGPFPNGIFLLNETNEIVEFHECFDDLQEVYKIPSGKLRALIKEEGILNGCKLRKFDVKGTL